ncbi:hypothetical protein QP923_08280 [Corynebacterium sp. MSK151]|uniref:hypothetical protein n=1 Tax=unclassified Corynebacterium TaxID=2624378 RepID=UPI002550EE4C|nr:MULTISPECIES: hypothetical protein [unclassified Corynebacterium]MDK8759589.1 hypothetical protein [Corynebacterium sp. MSK151]MDK8848613.1 hypothetical protein [Corynebacterium sp. MSK047]
MTPETRKKLLDLSRDHDTSWLSAIDEKSDFEQRARTHSFTNEMLREQYGIDPSSPQALKVHLEGPAAELAGVDKPLEAVQSAVTGLFAESPFNMDLKLTGIESGSTVLVYEPTQRDVVEEDVLGDPSVTVSHSSAHAAAAKALAFIKNIEAHIDQPGQTAALRRAYKLSQELTKHNLTAEFAWFSHTGNARVVAITESSAEYLNELKHKQLPSSQRKVVQGIIAAVAYAEDNLYVVTVRSSLTKRAQKNEVFVQQSAFKNLDKFIGDSVSWDVETTKYIDGFGSEVSARSDYVSDKVDYSQHGLF